MESAVGFTRLDADWAGTISIAGARAAGLIVRVTPKQQEEGSRLTGVA